MIQLLRGGHDPSSFSIDILDVGQVEETLNEAGIATAGAHVLPCRRGLTATDIVEFHQERVTEGVGVAITCLRSAYDVLKADATAIRLAPSIHSVRYAMQQLPLVAKLAATHGTVRVGFRSPAGHSTAQAASARSPPWSPCATTSTSPCPAPPRERHGDRRCRYSANDLAGQDDATVTTRTVAAALGVQQRTARRVLNRLERAGAAQSTGRQGLEGGGRPLVTYHLHL